MKKVALPIAMLFFISMAAFWIWINSYSIKPVCRVFGHVKNSQGDALSAVQLVITYNMSDEVTYGITQSDGKYSIECIEPDIKEIIPLKAGYSFKLESQLNEERNFIGNQGVRVLDP